ncbi:MAG: hypothetical protein ACPGSD_01405 [Flavobacteriales bacterium]
MSEIKKQPFLNDLEIDFLQQNLNTNPSTLIFKKDSESISYKKIAIQLEARNKIRKKLPSWAENLEITFPVKLSLEQSSSETTAKYKSGLVGSGKRYIDITGGMGVDFFYISKKFKERTYIDLNEDLVSIAKHNFKVLSHPADVECTNSIDFIKNSDTIYDVIFLDPARRKNGIKVFHLSDCLPNLEEHQQLLLSRSKIVFSKHSPLLDIVHLKNTLQNIKAIHIVSVSNDCKEVLVIQKKGYSGAIQIETINFSNIGDAQKYNSEYITPNSASIEIANQSETFKYIYIPNTSILKSGLSEKVSCEFGFKKLGGNTHFYTSNDLKERFPGRCFEVVNSSNQIKHFKKIVSKQKREVICRNAHQKPEDLIKKLNLKKGSNTHFVLAGKNESTKTIYFDCLRIF